LTNVGVNYKWNTKAWIKALIFQEWIISFDKIIRFKNPARKVILILDNAVCHNLNGIELKNVKLKFLPPNTTSKLQPLNVGIIACFKRKYRHFIRFLLNEYEQNFNSKKLDILAAIRFIVKSWSEVTENTIKNCWYHTGLTKEPVDFNFNEDNNEITVLRRDISKLNFTDPMDVSEYLNFTEEKIIKQIIDENE
jgi:hypothetical protein